jgi:hypothetical protein
MAEKPKHDEPEELDESELEEQDGEPLPDREAMSIITPTPLRLASWDNASRRAARLARRAGQ